MINLPDRELPELHYGNLYFPYKLIKESMENDYSATKHREIRSKQEKYVMGVSGNNVGEILSNFKINFHEIHLVDSFTTYDDKEAATKPYNPKDTRQIYYYVVESNPDIKEKILARLSPLNPKAVNTEKTTMDEYFIKSDYEAGYSNTNVFFYFLKEDTFEEFRETIKEILKDNNTNYDNVNNIHLKPSEMPYICHFGRKARYITAGPKDKDCMVAIDSIGNFSSQNGFSENKEKIYHNGSLFILEMGSVYAYDTLKKKSTGKNIIIGGNASIYFSDIEDGVIIGRWGTVGEQCYLGKKSIIHRDIKIDRFQSVGPYQEVKTPYPTILGTFDKHTFNTNVEWWLRAIEGRTKSNEKQAAESA